MRHSSPTQASPRKSIKFAEGEALGFYISQSTLCCLKMEQAQHRNRVHQFLETLVATTSVSRSQARVRLARKLSERSRLVRQRNNFRQRMKALAKSLETKEAHEIELVRQEIQLQFAV